MTKEERNGWKYSQSIEFVLTVFLPCPFLESQGWLPIEVGPVVGSCPGFLGHRADQAKKYKKWKTMIDFQSLALLVLSLTGVGSTPYQILYLIPDACTWRHGLCIRSHNNT